jgi:light-regulated signal transduction histidine kinase (bacteriophytochrome)
LEAFSYSISHDLRAPFRHIAGYAELLGERLTDLDEKSRHYLDSIVEAARSAGQLVDDLLNFSQLGRTSLFRTKVDVSKLVSEVILAVAPDLEGRNVEWRVGDLPPAWADGAMLRQVFANLIDNAVKYSAGRDPAVITIDGEDRVDEVAYTVSDNGVGFDMAYVGKLFGVFQRLHRAEEFAGTGIGLALSKRIVNRHGGSISAQGELERGVTVGFTLPKQT